MLEPLLAYAHYAAFMAVVVFLTAEGVLCRMDWLNAAGVRRLARLDVLYGLSALALLLTGLARTWWGMKGAGWYWSHPLLHLKLTLFVVVGLLSIQPTLRLLRWRRVLEATGALPQEAEVRSVRRRLMVQAHLLALVPLAAVFLARGWGR
jgi:putative membrane protein